MSELKLSENEKLQGSENYVIWEATITGLLKSKKLLKYINYDYYLYKKESLNGEPLSQNDLDFNEEIEAQDALASTIIFTNVTDKIKVYIKDCNSAKEKMNKIRKLYKTDDSIYYAKWIKKLYTLKAKNIENIMNIMNEIIELFRLLENSPMKPTELEKLSIMYNALPLSIKNKVNFTSSLTVSQFYNEINNKCIMYNYLEERWGNVNPKQNLEQNNNNNNYNNNNYNNYNYNNNNNDNNYDPMEIDNIENKQIKKIKQTYYYDKQKGYKNKTGKNKANNINVHCLICNNNGHLARDCYFNPCGTNRKNKRCVFNTSHNNNSYNNDNPYNNDNHINNIELEEKSTTPCYEEINTMFGQELSNIEYSYNNNYENNEINKTDDNIDLCYRDIYSNLLDTLHVDSILEDLNTETFSPVENTKVLSNLQNIKSRDTPLCNLNEMVNTSEWTFDTGASAHITNDKSLLKNFKQETIIMNCANKSPCTFEGYGTFHGEINGYSITLNKVLYSKDVNKNLISGLQLARSGINSFIRHIDNDIYLSLMTNDNKIITNIKCDTFNIARIKIKDNIRKYLEQHNMKKPKYIENKIMKLNKNSRHNTKLKELENYQKY